MSIKLFNTTKNTNLIFKKIYIFVYINIKKVGIIILLNRIFFNIKVNC